MTPDQILAAIDEYTQEIKREGGLHERLHWIRDDDQAVVILWEDIAASRQRSDSMWAAIRASIVEGE